LFRLLKTITITALASATLNAYASQDFFLQLDGIVGEYTDPLDSKAKGIGVLEWSWNMSNSSSFQDGSNGAGTKARFADISFTKYIDASTPGLHRLLVLGEQITTGTLRLTRGGGSGPNSKPFIFGELVMTNILVTSVSTGGSGGEDRLAEEISLNFASFCLRYVEQTLEGGSGAKPELCWNIAANESCTAQQIDDLFHLPMVASLPPNLVHQLTPVCRDS
jgi:type VI secretion system secreted protein Hcp